MESEASEEVGGAEEETEEELAYFFDTYAIVEIIKQNPSYLPYIALPVTITVFNLGEIYFAALRDLGEERADKIYAQYKHAIVEIDDNTMKDAMKFKKEMNKRQLSYADCIGYIYAKHNTMKFLTGDPQFEGMENVEFVR